MRTKSGLSGHDNIADVQRLVHVMPMHLRKPPLAIAFYVVFALWFTALRYSSSSFYSWLLAPIAGKILAFGTIAIFFTIVILATWREVRAASFPWVDAATIGCAIVGFDLLWRFYLSHIAWSAFKLSSIVLDVATPVIAILGMFAVGSELRRFGRKVESGNVPNG